GSTFDCTHQTHAQCRVPSDLTVPQRCTDVTGVPSTAHGFAWAVCHAVRQMSAGRVPVRLTSTKSPARTIFAIRYKLSQTRQPMLVLASRRLKPGTPTRPGALKARTEHLPRLFVRPHSSTPRRTTFPAGRQDSRANAKSRAVGSVTLL